ncbi:hypothetical protein J6590_063239 [Homalodisca vitripennis]|nr:hypothetical protein J6590_063239 [Homalodisca vitripennis]
MWGRSDDVPLTIALVIYFRKDWNLQGTRSAIQVWRQSLDVRTDAPPPELPLAARRSAGPATASWATGLGVRYLLLGHHLLTRKPGPGRDIFDRKVGKSNRELTFTTGLDTSAPALGERPR